MESIQSRLLKTFLRVYNYKKVWAREFILKKQLTDSHQPPRNVQKRCIIEKKQINGHYYYEMKPFVNAGKKHIFYIHGGGNVYEIMSLHWIFLLKLLDSLHCTITVPIYPLAPKHNFNDVFSMIFPLYQQVTGDINPEDITVMGDSAGGGMSLTLAQLLKENGMAQPGNIILISPSLDLTFSNPEIHEYIKYDPIISFPHMIEIAKWYAGEKGVDHPLVSAIYSNLEGLGKISLFTGTHDILYPEAKKFRKLAEENAIRINYFEYPEMLHIWPLFSLPESETAINQIIDIIKS